MTVCHSPSPLAQSHIGEVDTDSVIIVDSHNTELKDVSTDLGSLYDDKSSPDLLCKES